MFVLKGKIDTNNSHELEEKLLKELPTEIDASGLEYISSSGLRTLLRLRKAVGKVTIKNVKPEIYEIFEVTGFTDILDIE